MNRTGRNYFENNKKRTMIIHIVRIVRIARGAIKLVLKEEIRLMHKKN